MTEEEKTVKLTFQDPRYDSWDFGVKGAPEIRKEGTEVPADKVKALRNAARKRGIELKKV